MRMTQDTFYYILNKIEHRLAKTWNNWHRQPIPQEERLVYSCEGAGKNGLRESFSWLTLAACADKLKQVSAVLTYIQLHGDILGAG